MSYNEFIQNIIDTRGRFGILPGEIKQRHHIIPRCKGGTDDLENLIDLYPEEHYDAHRILFEENKNDIQLGLAWACFHLFNNTEITREEYGDLWRNFISLQSKRYAGDGNPHWGIHTNYNSSGFTGHTHFDKTKVKMSENNLWKKLGTSNRKGCKISKNQIEALQLGLKNVSKEKWSETNKRNWEIRRKNGTTNTTNNLKWYNNGIQSKLFTPGTQPIGWVGGMAITENMINSKEKISLKSKEYHQRIYKEYIESINIEYYLNLFIELKQKQKRLSLKKFCENNQINLRYFKRYLKENNIQWQN